MGKIVDLCGKEFGKLVVIRFSHINDKKNAVWECLCECGKVAYVTSANLNRGSTKSCGCARLVPMRMSNIKHGCASGERTPEYRIWKNMRNRCLSANNPAYDRYGGRGITICERWDDFNNFLHDMGIRPSDKHSLDRIDVNKGYDQNNCRWATAEMQARNKRIVNPTGVPGVRKRKDNGKWHAVLKIKGKVKHLGYFSILEDAIKARKNAEVLFLEDGRTV